MSTLDSTTLYTNNITVDGFADGGIVKATYKEICDVATYGLVSAGENSLASVGFSITHTPVASGHKLLIGVQLCFEIDDPYNKNFFVKEGFGGVESSPSPGNRLAGTAPPATSHGGNTQNNDQTLETVTFWVQDLTFSTSPMTYTLYMNSSVAEPNIYINRTQAEGTTVEHERAMSWMQVWEISS